MNALALALLLTLTAGADDAPEPAAVASAPARRDFRVGGGAAAFQDVDGVAPTAEIGVEVEPWRRLGLRLTFGTSMRVGWGSIFLSPELVVRLLPREAAASPYLTAGAQVAALNITKSALGLPDIAESRAAASGNIVTPEPTGGSGPSPLEFSAGPQAGVGVTFPILGATLDLGLRYNLHFWDGEAYSGLGVLLTLIGPATF